MNEKTSTESIRFAPLALAIALTATLGLVALCAHAEEVEAEASALEQTQESGMQEQRNIFSEHVDAQQEEFDEAQGELTQMRGGKDSAEAFQIQQTERREEMQLLKNESKTAFAEDRAKRLQAYRSFLDTKKNDIQARIQEHQALKESKQEEYKARLNLSAQVRMGQYVERIVARMDAGITRLEQIAERIATRIEKTEEEGVDLSNAKVDLANINILIEDAHEYVALIGEISTETLTSEAPKVREIRDAVNLAKDSISTVHTALSETVKLIHEGIMEEVRTGEAVEEESLEEEGVEVE